MRNQADDKNVYHGTRNVSRQVMFIIKNCLLFPSLIYYSQDGTYVWIYLYTYKVDKVVLFTRAGVHSMRAAT